MHGHQPGLSSFEVRPAAQLRRKARTSRMTVEHGAAHIRRK
jgi:hypothetical protein